MIAWSVCGGLQSPGNSRQSHEHPTLGSSTEAPQAVQCLNQPPDAREQPPVKVSTLEGAAGVKLRGSAHRPSLHRYSPCTKERSELACACHKATGGHPRDLGHSP